MLFPDLTTDLFRVFDCMDREYAIVLRILVSSLLNAKLKSVNGCVY
jgi:hypothetical protein